MTKGKLILIPTVIGENTAKETLPSIIIDTIKNTDIYIVENIRSARRFIKKIYAEKNIEDILLYKEKKVELYINNSSTTY